MAKKKSVPTFEHPVASIDMRIIANARAALWPAFEVKERFAIEPFLCYRRGYALQDGIVLMFDPDRFDIRRSRLMLIDTDEFLEIWMLHDDKVVEYFELGNPSNPPS